MSGNEVAQLEAERKEILEKIRLLEEKKGSVRESVYKKVKSEYEARLKQVEDSLRQHRDYMEKRIAEIDREIAELASRKDRIEEALEEVNLRNELGEFSDEEYQKRKAPLDKELSQLDAKAKELREEKAKLQEFISSLGEEKAEVIPPPQPEARSEEPAEEILEEIQPQGVVPDLEGETAPEIIPEERETEETIELPELDEGEKLVEELFSEATEETPNLDIVPQSVAVNPEAGSGEPGPQQEAGSEGEGAKCPHCGHINAADAWFCEKCGGDLNPM